MRASAGTFALLLLATSAVAPPPWRGPGGAAATADPLAPRLELRDARHPGTDTPARTGRFRVWEDRAARTGRVLELEVVILPALDTPARPDPVFVFAGGPGQDATRLVDGWADHWMRRQRDIVLVSQRGTGGDNRLTCRLPGSDANLQGYLDPLMDEAAFRDCLADLRERFDLRMYSTAMAMDDIDDVRRALGYGKINLFGGSYGSRAALEFLRRHGDAVRCVILNSVAPVAFRNPLYHARSAQEALDLILDECADDPACRAVFGDLRAKLDRVWEHLGAGPVPVTVRHPATGAAVDLSLSRNAFAEALRVLMYYDSRRVPLLIHRAFAGDYAFFAQAGLEVNRALRSSLAFGMLLCVTCGEDVDRIDPAEIPVETAGCFLGDERVRGQKAICDFWPRSAALDQVDEPVRSDVPVLLFSGRLDPVTPPRWGEAAARHLANGLHLVAPGSHGVGGACVTRIMRDFIADPRIEDLDVSCVDEMELGAFASPDAAEAAP